MMPLWTIISDDLTGLQAIAGEFARLGLRVGTGTSRVPTREELERFEIFGFDTATRALPAGDAERRVAEVARQLIAAGATRIFKHNDSILQGHVGAEMRAIAQAIGEGGRPIVYAPACPNRNRVTRGAIQLEIDGNGATVAGGLRKDLREVVARDTGLSTGVIDLDRVRDGEAAALLASAAADVVVADAVTDEDLDRIASDSLRAGCRVLSGSVGLAAAVARAAAPPQRLRHPVLVLAGSLQSATQSQVEHLLARADCAGFAVPADGNEADGDVARIVPRLRSALSHGLHCVVWTPRSSNASAAAGVYPVLPPIALDNLRRKLGAILRGVIAHPEPPLGGLVAAGGLTADLVLREVLGITQFSNLGWLCEGMTVALAVDGAHPGLAVVTKSGGWGRIPALSDAVDHCAVLRRAPPPSISLQNPAPFESLA
jgi:uncharacterized protein YgbK (DUF1537 family)